VLNVCQFKTLKSYQNLKNKYKKIVPVNKKKFISCRPKQTNAFTKILKDKKNYFYFKYFSQLSVVNALSA